MLLNVPAGEKTLPVTAPGSWREYWLVQPGGMAHPLLATRRRPEDRGGIRCLVRCPHDDVGDGSLLPDLPASPPVGTSPSPPESSASPPVGTSLLLTDSFVDIWEFRLAPGESCAFHTHTRPYVFTNLAVSDTVELDARGGRVGEARRQVVGDTVLVSQEALGSHGVLNSGDSTFLQFILEFKMPVEF